METQVQMHNPNDGVKATTAAKGPATRVVTVARPAQTSPSCSSSLGELNIRYATEAAEGVPVQVHTTIRAALRHFDAIWMTVVIR